MTIMPGQSLTAEPKNAPYENPPQMNKPEDATMWHLERLVESDRMEALFDTLELGVDVVTLTEGLLRAAVLDGRHSIDISLIIAPVIHEFITTSAEEAGIDFEEGFPDDTEEREMIKYQVREAKSAKKLAELGYGKESSIAMRPMSEKTKVLDKVEEEEAPAVTAPKGLMVRKGDVS